MDKPTIFKRQDLVSIGNIRKMIPGKNGGPCSRQHVHNLIDNGLLTPAFRFGGKYNIHVPRIVVERYLESCQIDTAA